MNRWRSITLLCAIFMLSNHTEARQRFYPTTKSLEEYQSPEWLQDAKLGYWVTWGIYSVPAFAGDHAAEWYGRWMYTIDDNSGEESGYGYDKRGLKTAAYHREHYGDPKEFEYKDFIPMWKAEKFDADEWADLFVEGGAKFFTMMAMHHDNYPLWNSVNVPINSYTTGPKCDFVAEMERAIRSRGLHFGLSNHSAWNSRFFQYNHRNKLGAKEVDEFYGMADPDSHDVERWWARSTELVEKYHPDLMWFDWCWNQKPFVQQTRMNFCSWYYNMADVWKMSSERSPEVAVAYKGASNLPIGAGVLDLERGGMADIEENLWMNDTSLGLKSWSYAPDEVYRSANQVIDMLLDIISKNGVLQLNIGPKADGTIPEVAQNSIRHIGEWLAKNGEGVYSTRAWEIYGEGPTVPSQSMDGDVVEYCNKDIRFTRSKDNKTLYIHVLGYNDSVEIESLGRTHIDMSTLKSVKMLDGNEKVEYKQGSNSFSIKFPESASKEESAYTFKVKFKGEIPKYK